MSWHLTFDNNYNIHNKIEYQAHASNLLLTFKIIHWVWHLLCIQTVMYEQWVKCLSWILKGMPVQCYCFYGLITWNKIFRISIIDVSYVRIFVFFLEFLLYRNSLTNATISRQFSLRTRKCICVHALNEIWFGYHNNAVVWLTNFHCLC